LELLSRHPDWTDGPFKPGFGLSVAVLQLERVLLPLFRASGTLIRLDLYSPSQSVAYWRKLLHSNTRSPPQVTALAMICFRSG
ncbi:MAG TPA: hypothetical protein VGV15_11295, partial [Terriglobales bacterium]|nr:hypothetical protein [Terriglobales bacterium]